MDPRHQHDDKDIDDRGADRTDRRSPHAKSGKSQQAEDKDQIDAKICQDGRNAGHKRNPDPFHGPQQRALCHGEHLERIGEPYNSQILHADVLYFRTPRVQRHHRMRGKQRKKGKNDARDHHERQGHSKGTADIVMLAGSIELGEEQHPAPYKAPVAGEHQA